MRAAPPLPPAGFQATIAASPDHVRALETALVAARAGEERFRMLVESIEAVPYISDWDAAGTIRYISPKVEALLGFAPDRWYAAGDLWEDRIHPDDAERVLAESARTFSHGEDFASEYRLIAADGRVVWIAERETIVRDEEGRPCFCHGVMFDITRLKTAEQRTVAAEAALREERDLAQRYLDVARTMLLVLDADETVRLLNQHGHEALGHAPGSLIGRNWFDVAVPASTRERNRESFRRAMAGRDPGDDGVETVVLTATGDERTMTWKHALLRMPDGTPSGSLSSGEDITDRLRAESEIRRLAYHDHLTGLPNRTHFDATLRAAVAAAPASGHAVGLLFVDLDNFKLVNDSLGHAVGDELLRAVAEPLAGVEGPGMLGRHGGDEFLVLLRALPGGHALRIDASVGVSLFPQDADDADVLMRLADAGMYRAKGRSDAPAVSR